MKETSWLKWLTECCRSRRDYKSSHLCAEVSFVTSTCNTVQILPTGAQPGVHVSHLPLHQLSNRWTSGQSDSSKRKLNKSFNTMAVKIFEFLFSKESEKWRQNLKVSDLLSESLSDMQIGNSSIQNRLHDAEKQYEDVTLNEMCHICKVIGQHSKNIC